MTKREQRSQTAPLTSIQPRMTPISPQQFGHSPSWPYFNHNSAPDGMTIDQAQLVWSCAIELFTDRELTEILVESLRDSSVSQSTIRERPFNPDNVSTIHQDVFDARVINILSEIAAKAPIVRIENQGSSIILRRSMWGHLTYHLLSIVVHSGEATEDLDELLLSKELGL